MLIRRPRGERIARALPALFALALFTSAANAGEKPALPGMTDSSLQKLPDWSGWWTVSEAIPAEYTRNPAPLRPEDMAKIRSASSQDSDPDPARYCRPPRFVGYSGGFVDNVAFLFPSRR